MVNYTKYDIIIHNGIIITVNADFDIIKNGIICILDGKIELIAENTGAFLPEADEIIDACSGIIMPGIVNTHTHLPMTLFRGLADDLPLDIWLNEHIFPAEAKYICPETVRYGTLLACSEMLLSGTTTCCDGYFFEDMVAEAVYKAGIRAILGHGVIDFPAPGVPDPSKNIDHAAEFADRWHGISPLITPSIFCHSTYTCSEKTLKCAVNTAQKKGILFQIHAAETQKEWKQIFEQYKMTPVQWLDKIGVLDAQPLLVHAIWVDDSDIQIIKNKAARVSITTESEMKLGSGIAPIPKFLNAGILVGIGTDGCASNNDLDMFREMDVTAKLHKVIQNDREYPAIVDAKTLLKLATIGGASAIGLDHKIGSLETGKQADIIIINTRHPRLVPMYNPVSHIVYAVSGSDVKDVIIAGKSIVRNRKILTLNIEDIMNHIIDYSRWIKKNGE